MINRRSIILGSSALVLSSQFRDVRAQHDQPVRYGAATPEGKKMLRIYAQGVAAMKALPPQDPKSWTFQWYIHAVPRSKEIQLDRIFQGASGDTFELALEIWFTCQAHNRQPEDYFLPWHRLYVMQFEEIIRALTGRDEFTLPYWDYTAPGFQSIPDEFQSKNSRDPVLSSLFVPNRNRDGGQIRSADVNAGEPLNKHLRNRNIFALPNLREPNYSRFCRQLDTLLHNQVHLYVGDFTNMGDVPTAAGDPIFWLHHCNIDRIWSAWNLSGGRNPSSTNGTSWADTGFVFADGEGQRVEIAIGTISDSEALPYRYDKLPGVRPGTVLASTSSEPTVLLKSVRSSAAATATAPSSPPAAVALGWAPVKTVLAPTVPQNRLSAVATGIQRTDAVSVILLLKDVQTQINPNTVYEVFLDLPDNASDEVQDLHYVGLLNFFGMGAEAGGTAQGGRDIEFDITDLIKRLGATAALQSETSVTIAPVGAPSASSTPTISGGIEIKRW